MTPFRRTRHLRRSKYGTPHWVGESVVHRDDWSRSGNRTIAAYAYADRRLTELRARTGVTSAFVNPNARCPVCGEPVYYYQNEHGSRVFFDELGVPWPKHPCTDIGDAARAGRASQPIVRSSGERAEIRRHREDHYENFEAEYRNNHHRQPPRLFKVVKRIPTKRTLLLILERLGGQDGRLRFCEIGKRLTHLREGAVVSQKGSELSFFDMGRMTSRSAQVLRIGSAKAFIRNWISETA